MVVSIRGVMKVEYLIAFIISPMRRRLYQHHQCDEI